MKRSTERILTTHAGSLPRPDDLLEMLRARADGQPLDERAFDARLRSAVAEIVREQVAHGLDVVDDGEQGKTGFSVYTNERLAGFELRPGASAPSQFATSREHRDFPEYYQAGARMPSGAGAIRPPGRVCTGPIAYVGQSQLQRDLDNLKAALEGVAATEAFVPAISPSMVSLQHTNEYYRTDEEYEAAIADAMHEEYKAIVDAGFLVQIDDPHLVTQYMRKPELSLAQCRQWAEHHVEVLNHALRDIPRDRIRFHTCYSINMGPRVHDMELKDIVDIILKIHAGAHSFEAANPRHEHEWRVWENVKLPEGTILIPGVITQSTVLVEHPELVADRILRFASVVGRENVIAGADCGFATFAGASEIHPKIAWAKLDALVAGARLASQRLWGGSQ